MRQLGVSNTVLPIICLMYLILYMDRVNISTAAPLIKADLDLSNTQLGLVFSAFAPIWAVPMDIAPKYSGSASGMMNFGFGVAGIAGDFDSSGFRSHVVAEDAGNEMRFGCGVDCDSGGIGVACRKTTIS